MESMKYALLFLVGCIVCSLAWAVIPPPSELVGDMNDNSLEAIPICNHWSCAAPCKAIHAQAKKALKSESVTDCMMTLFFKESTCNTHGPQEEGNQGNPEEGFGLCTLETSSDLRATRGPNCIAASPTNVTAQILCCRDIMKKFSKAGSYFGPVRRSEVPKCL